MHPDVRSVALVRREIVDRCVQFWDEAQRGAISTRNGKDSPQPSAPVPRNRISQRLGKFYWLCHNSSHMCRMATPTISPRAPSVCRNSWRRVYEMTDWSRYPSSSVRDASDWRALCLFALRMITWYFTARGLPGRSLVLLLVPTVQLRQLLDSEASTLSDLFARRSHRERLFRQMEPERTTQVETAHNSIWPAFRSTLSIVIPTRNA